jgi:hypothetical protein
MVVDEEPDVGGTEVLVPVDVERRGLNAVDRKRRPALHCVSDDDVCDVEPHRAGVGDVVLRAVRAALQLSRHFL